MNRRALEYVRSLVGTVPYYVRTILVLMVPLYSTTVEYYVVVPVPVPVVGRLTGYIVWKVYVVYDWSPKYSSLHDDV